MTTRTALALLAVTLALALTATNADVPVPVQLLASDGAEADSFGAGVALSADGGTVAIGSRYDDDNGFQTGSVYVFVRGALPGFSWAFQQRLQADTAVVGEELGEAVALSADGNTLAAGAPGAVNDRGFVYVFTRAGSVWTQQQQIAASDAADDDTFGVDVALSADGDTLVCGTGAADAAYVMTRSGGVWTELAILTDASGAASDFFGASVAISGDAGTVAVGAQRATGGASSHALAGAAVVFELAAGPSYPFAQKVDADDAAVGTLFGTAVALDAAGTTLVVGCDGDDRQGANAGAVYVMTRAAAGNAFAAQSKLAWPAAEIGARLGQSVAVSADGNVIAAGAFRFGAAEDGATFYSVRGTGAAAADSWSALEAADVTADPSVSEGAWMGASVSVAASPAGPSAYTLVAGAPSDNDAVLGDRSGAAYLGTACRVPLAAELDEAASGISGTSLELTVLTDAALASASVDFVSVAGGGAVDAAATAPPCGCPTRRATA